MDPCKDDTFDLVVEISGYLETTELKYYLIQLRKPVMMKCTVLLLGHPKTLLCENDHRLKLKAHKYDNEGGVRSCFHTASVTAKAGRRITESRCLIFHSFDRLKLVRYRRHHGIHLRDAVSLVAVVNWSNLIENVESCVMTQMLRTKV